MHPRVAVSGRGQCLLLGCHHSAHHLWDLREQDQCECGGGVQCEFFCNSQGGCELEYDYIGPRGESQAYVESTTVLSSTEHRSWSQVHADAMCHTVTKPVKVDQ